MQQSLANLFYDLFSGVYKNSISPEQNERFELTTRKIVKIIEDLAEEKAIEVCARLGEATKEGFVAVGKALDNKTDTKASRF